MSDCRIVKVQQISGGRMRTAASLAAQTAAEAHQWEVAMQIGSLPAKPLQIFMIFSLFCAETTNCPGNAFGSCCSSSLATAFGAKLLWSHSLLLVEGLVQGEEGGWPPAVA